MISAIGFICWGWALAAGAHPSASQPANHQAPASRPVASILDPVVGLAGNPKPEITQTDAGTPIFTLFTGEMSRTDFLKLGPPPPWAYGDYSEPRPPTGRPWPFSARGLDFLPVQEFRRTAEEFGIELRYRQVLAFQTLASGGYRTAGASGFIGRGDIDLVVRLWPGGAFHMQFQNSWGNSLNTMGKIQGEYGTNDSLNSAFGVNRDVSSEPAYITDCYFLQRFGLGQLFGEDVSLSLAIGRPNTTDFVNNNVYTSNFRQQFLNRSFSLNPTVPFIDGTLAVAAAVTHPWMYVSTILYDSQGDPGFSDFQTALGPNPQFTWFLEWALTPTLVGENGNLPGHYRFGCWVSNQPTQDLSYNTFNGALPERYVSCNNGFYLSFDQVLIKENADPEDRQGLGVWVQMGWAQPNLSPVNQFWALGCNYRGLIPTRNQDELGVGFATGQTLVAAPVDSDSSSTTATANNRTAPISPAIYGQESVFEIYYNIQVFPWLIVTPDLQYLVNPGGVPGYGRDALVIGFKTYMSF